MLSLFKTNSIILSVILIPYALLLRSYGLSNKITTDFDNSGLVSDFIYETLNLGQQGSFVVALILLFAQAVLLILITNNHKFSGDSNLFVGVFYVMTGSIGVSYLGLNPALIGNTFLILALMNLFGIFKEKEPSGHHFGAGFWLALAALSYGSLFIFLFFGLFAINVLRAFNIKEMLQLISGYLVPFILFFTYFYAIGDTQDSFLPYLSSSFGIMDLRDEIQAYALVPIGVIFSIFIALIVNYNLLMEKQVMKTKKNINILFLFILFGAMSFVIQADVWLEHFTILAIPFSILLGILFTKMKSTVWKEVWHFLLFLIIPISHYFLT